MNMAGQIAPLPDGSGIETPCLAVEIPALVTGELSEPLSPAVSSNRLGGNLFSTRLECGTTSCLAQCAIQHDGTWGNVSLQAARMSGSCYSAENPAAHSEPKQVDVTAYKVPTHTALIIADGSLTTGRVIGARIGKGVFHSSSARLLDPEANLHFMTKVVGGSLPKGPFTNYTDPSAGRFTPKTLQQLDESILSTFGVASYVQAIQTCFDAQTFSVEKPVKLREAQLPTEQELRVLRLIQYGLTRQNAANRTDIAKPRIDMLFENLFTKLGVGNVRALVTVGYLAGLLS